MVETVVSGLQWGYIVFALVVGLAAVVRGLL